VDDLFLVPANSKKGTLIFGLFLKVDLIIMGVGVATTFLLLLIFGAPGLWLSILFLLPSLIAAMLVFPMPNYHNVRTFLGEMIEFYSGLRKYIWKGWCYKE